MDLCLAVDVGGTKMAAGLIDASGRVVEESSIPTLQTDDPEGLFQGLATMLAGVLEKASGSDRGESRSVVVCGVGCGGPMSIADGTVSPLNIPSWREGFPLRERLSQLTGLKVGLDNDAKALTLGEGWLGSAMNCRDYMGMVVSTGVGGGIVLDGRLLDGATGNAGHVGHVVVEPEGRVCSCTGRGCLEAEASGSAIAALTGRPPSEASPEIVARTGMLVGRAVASVSNLLDLELAVIGGSVALGFGAPFFSAANTELGKRARLSFSRSSRIEPVGLGAKAPLVGAGAVGWRVMGLDVLGTGT